MKVSLFFIFICTNFSLHGQIQPGFNTKEVSATIAMCNSFNFIKQFNSNQEIIPNGYTLLYSSEVQSMDNKFEVYISKNKGFINFRGSTNNAFSWVENFYSAMIPAQDTLEVSGEKLPYCFAKNQQAAVHAGYALSVVILSKSILEQIKQLNNKGIYHIIITGHSQGGALATMTRAYLENLPDGVLSKKNTYKTYAFAQPMCGNKEFAAEYNALYSENGTSYSIINPKDAIPNMPFNYEEDTLVNSNKIKGWLFGDEIFNAKVLGKNMLFRLFENGITNHILSSNKLINKVLDLKFGGIKMPEFLRDINYYPTGDLKEITPFTYPKIEVAISAIKEEELKNYTKANNGKWYKKEPKFFQHSPYNYYVQVLKLWNKPAYNKLKKHYLVSDL